MEIIGYIETDFDEKFGIPRQSGLAKDLVGRIVMTPKYRLPDAFKGIEEFEYLWLLWEFEEAGDDHHFRATVRPPRLGGNETKGVFATRSPYRPNSIGLSSVKLIKVDITKDEGPVLYVGGADLRNHTPIYDIKPYLKYVDCHEDANDGFAHAGQEHILNVDYGETDLSPIPVEKRSALTDILRLDPRPSYHNDPERVYGVRFAGCNVRFRVDKDVLTVLEIQQ